MKNMESVVQVVRGAKLNAANEYCTFCGKPAFALFLITKEQKYDGTLINSFPICQEHLDKLNAILSGEFDIDEIFLAKWGDKPTKRVQLRQ